MISETEAGSNSEPWFNKLIEVQRYIENRNASAIKHKIREFSDQVCSKMMRFCLFHLHNLMKDKYKYEQHWSWQKNLIGVTVWSAAISQHLIELFMVEFSGRQC